MVKTLSNMMQLGTVAPDFTLRDVVSGEDIKLDNIKLDKAIVVMFICNHCPFVKHIQSELVQLANDYIPHGITFVAISSNDVDDYPEDSPERMKEVADILHFPFPYLFDKTQNVAKVYNAACTPDFFVFDRDLRCVYRGRLDDSTPGNSIPPTGKELRQALDCVLAEKPVSADQKPSVGCNIKWKCI